MFEYTTGNILESEAECLVNTVNCEGYMGKGIAYQFKVKYPENNKDYIKACKKGMLKIGTLHYFKENGKIIINFPTKDKWRKKSEIEYIEKGLDKLKTIIPNLNINSIAIPPLGCGNGGLKWEEVKVIIQKKLIDFSDNLNIIIYEPSKNYKATPKTVPIINISHLILMQIKIDLDTFNSIRLQKTAYLMNIFLKKEYFKFIKYKYGPYANSINVISRDIKEFQSYYNTKSTEEAYNIALNISVSNNIENKLKEMLPSLNKAVKYVNKINNDKQLECISTIIYIIDNKIINTDEDIIREFKSWSEDKANRFTENDIRWGIDYLIETNLIVKTLIGFEIIRY